MKLHELGQAIRITLAGNAEVVIPTDHPHYKQITRLDDYTLQGSSGSPDAPTFLFSPRKPVVILAKLPGGIAADVILNGQIIYYEDDDGGYHQNFTAEEVAKRLAKTLKVKLRRVTVSIKDAGGDEWNHEELTEAATRKVK